MPDSGKPLVQALVAGTRKAGTTWLYENFRQDPNLRVSEKVKESGYFAGTGPASVRAYEHLYASAAGGSAVEVDSSVCYVPDAAQRILAYNSEMSVSLIFRSPEEFLVSRHRHGLRKGEVAQEDPVEALANTPWLREELDYSAITERFATLADRGQLTIFFYDELQRDPEKFYADVKRALGTNNSQSFSPTVTAVNVGRISKAPFVSRLLSDSAKIAHRFGAHNLVNRAKALGLHSRLEETTIEPVSDASGRLRDAIEQFCPGTLEWFENARSQKLRPS